MTEPPRCPTCGAFLRRLTAAEVVLHRHMWKTNRDRQLELDRGLWARCDHCQSVVMVQVSPRR